LLPTGRVASLLTDKLGGKAKPDDRDILPTPCGALQAGGECLFERDGQSLQGVRPQGVNAIFVSLGVPQQGSGPFSSFFITRNVSFGSLPSARLLIQKLTKHG